MNRQDPGLMQFDMPSCDEIDAGFHMADWRSI